MGNYGKIFTKMFVTVISFIVILMTVMGFATYFYSSDVIKTELAETNINMLTQLQETTETYVLKQAEDFIIKNFLQLDTTSERLKIFSNEELNNRFLLDYYQELQQLALTADYIADIHIYIPHREMIVSTSGIRFLSGERKRTAFDSEKMEIFQRAMTGTKWVNTYVNSNGINVVTLLRQYAPVARAVPRGIIAVDIEEARVYSTANEFPDSNMKNVFITDENGNMISHANKEMLYQDVSGKEYMKRIMESEEPFGYFIDRVNGQKSLVTYSKSEYNHWNYISVSDASTVFGISNIILLFIVIMYIILLIAGCIGVFLMSKSFYKPINRIVDTIGSLTGERKRGDDYTIISNALDTLSSQLSDYESMMDDIKPVMKNNLLMQLMYDADMQAEEIKNNMEILGIDPDTARVFVVMSCMFHYSGMKREEERYFEYGFIEYMFTFGNSHRLVLCHSTMQNKVIVLVGAENVEQLDIGQILGSAETGLRELEGVEYNIHVSGIIQGLENIHTGYEGLSVAEEYRFIYGYNHILRTDEVQPREASVATLEEESLFSALRSGIQKRNLDDVLMLLNQMMVTLKSGSFSCRYVQDFLMRLIAFLSNLLKEQGLETGEVVDDKQTLYEEYRKSENLDGMFGFLQDLCINMVEHKDGEEGGYDVSEKVKAFLRSLPDSEMKNVTLSYVSDRLFLSQSYVSRVFKAETGVNFIDYLSEEKLVRSARMLTERNMKIKDICEVIGYSNSNYYIRKFKEKYGVTPKQYQRNMR